MIRLQEVFKSFGKVHAVRGVTLDIPAGQIVGILGPNGAGKSTTIRMIAGLLPPSAGTVNVDGLDTIDQSRPVRRRLGYLPESNPLYPEMSVEQYLRFRARLFGISRRAGRTALARVIERCGLENVRRRRIGELSKGYRQRVGLAAALLHDPAALILDEPTSGLDPSQIAETRRLIRELAGRRTMLLVSHILPEVEKTCDRIIIFAHGQVQADGTREELIRKAGRGRQEVQRCVLEARAGDRINDLQRLLSALPGVGSCDLATQADGWVRARIAGKPGVPDLREEIGSICAREKLVIRELSVVGDAESLESLYIRLVEGADAAPHGENGA